MTFHAGTIARGAAPARWGGGIPQARQRRDAQIGGMLRIEEVTAGRLKGAECPAKHRLAHVAILRKTLRLDGVVVITLRGRPTLAPCHSRSTASPAS